MVPSKIKIESFAKRYHMGTLGGKGLSFSCFVAHWYGRQEQTGDENNLLNNK